MHPFNLPFDIWKYLIEGLLFVSILIITAFATEMGKHTYKATRKSKIKKNAKKESSNPSSKEKRA